MLDLFLKAATEAALKAAMPWLVNADGEWITATHQWALDPIGAVVATPAVFDSTTTPPTLISAPVYADGWHANLRLLDETLAASVPASVQVAVTSPSRVWA